VQAASSRTHTGTGGGILMFIGNMPIGAVQLQIEAKRRAAAGI
jgi:hypothetical protein